jgi:hypothetical protein
MATFSKQFLSSSINSSYNGLPIELKTSGTTTELEEIWLYGSNTNSSEKVVVLQMGNTGSQYEVVQSLAGRSGLTLLVPGIVIGKIDSLSGVTFPAAGCQVAGYVGGTGDAATSGVTIIGYVNRISGSV